MKPTEILSEEHRVIEQVLDCLEKMAQNCMADGQLDKTSAEQALDFFRNFADRCHHGKEETHLFPAMEAKGFSRDGGPTGVMFHEHDQGRAHVQGMADAVEEAAAGKSKAVTQFITHARGYVDLLRGHIEKEDHCLFTMANQTLTAADQQKLLDAFENVEHEHMGLGTHEKFLAIAEELADRFGVARAVDSRSTCGCSHGTCGN
ncbi:MAG: hemerythrin domain-containing protein [Planctomycetota bacterium]